MVRCVVRCSVVTGVVVIGGDVGVVFVCVIVGVDAAAVVFLSLVFTMLSRLLPLLLLLFLVLLLFGIVVIHIDVGVVIAGVCCFRCC